MSAIIDKLKPIFRTVFDDDDLVIFAATKADDIDEWDSLAHIRLVVSIEKDFGLRFTTDEISNLGNVGDMADLIIQKQSNG
jgi:acyl carrier protein